MSLSKQLTDEINRANSLKSGVLFGDSGATVPNMIFIEAETKASA